MRRLGYDQVVFPLRIATLLASFVAYSVVVDPGGFSNKAFARLPKLGAISRRIKRETDRPESTARHLERVGEYTQALEVAGPVSRIRLRNAIRELHLEPRSATDRPSSPIGSTGRKRRAHTVVAPITNSLPYTQAGYSLRTHELFSAVSKLGVSVHAITRPGYPVIVGRTPRKKTEEIDEVTYHRNLPHIFPPNPEATLKRATEEIVGLARKVDADVIHTTSRFTNGLAAGQAAAQLSLPWIYEVRGREERTWLSSLPQDLRANAKKSELFRLSEMQESKCLDNADHVIALSEIMRQEFIDTGVPAEKITVIPNGVDDRIFDFTMTKEEARARLGLPSKKIIGSISSLVHYEGIETLIHAGIELSDDYRILIVGDGEEKARLEQIANDYGLNDKVIFAGKQAASTIWVWYRALDVYIVPRLDAHVTRTVTPIKPLAAQALRIPVIASDLPPLREVVGNEAGFVPPGSSTDIAKAVADAPTLDTLAAHNHARSRTWSTFARRLQSLYLSQ